MSRTRLIVIAAVVFLVLVAAGAVGRAYFAEPGPWTDYFEKINGYIDRTEPEGEAAWPVYREMILGAFAEDAAPDDAFAPFRAEMQARLDERDAGTIHEDAWDHPRHERVRALLDVSDPILAALDEASTRPRLGKRYVRRGNAITGEQDADAVVSVYSIDVMSEVRPLRQASWLNAGAARAAAESGDWDGFAQRIETGVALGSHVTRVGSLIEYIVGLSITSQHAKTVRLELTEKTVPDETCERLDRALAIGLREPVRAALDVERMMLDSGLESFYDRGGMAVVWRMDDAATIGLPGLDPDPTWLDRLGNLRAYLLPSLEESRDRADESYAAFREAVDVPPNQFVAALDDPVFGPTGNQVVDLVIPAIKRILRNTRLLERNLRATRLMLRLERIHAETGAWPESLDAPEFAELNEDPLTGEPFAYERTPSDPHARPYVLTAPQTPFRGVGGEELNPPRPSFEEDDAN